MLCDNDTGNKLFKLDPRTVDFYVPQLVNLLLTRKEVSEAIRPYLVARYGRAR